MNQCKKVDGLSEKSVKNMVYRVEKGGFESGSYQLFVTVKCASNESLNPANLLVSLYDYSGVTFESDKARIKRLDLYALDDKKEFVPLFDFDKK